MNLKPLFVIALMAAPSLFYAQQVPKGYKLVYEEDFEKGSATQQFRFTQPSKWISSAGKTGKALEFTGISDYQPPFRSPHTIGLIGNTMAGSFVLEADLLQTGKEYGHRDMCVVFGFTDPSHFYYSHIATKMDDNAHQIMLVNEAPRKKISTFTTEGVDWGNSEWQHIRIERDLDQGSIKVFFNGKLIQEASDKTFGKGYIGFGSFDDSGKIDNIRIWAKDSEKKGATFFEAK
ncbi:hypothetical protein KK083_15615 [Fulvivirgaceae bacterium PWU4]|uniref:LamG domain-containing protein n=1 Tax=Chryseosolibacter histidini TaxID=2782349 RepID=A0AAP2GNS3_9BACT|nr:DUF1080 domain-containing protein [Chryseosolibacter histidini]MBT1698318.1 hypothetical protein [Chryseosolibacter histidini]